jgi:DNA-binding NtrC family response regulator
MSTSPDPQNSELHDLVEGWKLASCSSWTPETFVELLRWVRERIPVASFTLFELETASSELVQRARVRASSGNATGGNATVDSLHRPCSEAKWNELNKWVGTGELLKQASPKRSGKLAFLVPEDVTGAAIAGVLKSPLAWRDRDGTTPTGSTIGAVVYEIAHGRSLRNEQLQWLQQWTHPLWLLLDRNASTSTPSAPPTHPNTIATNNALTTNEDTKTLRQMIVGAESGLKAVMERVQLVASSDVPVLILGDTGTGKEVVARAIHTRSPRASKPFLRVNCGAIPPELIDSQLFGHERGSFTGASDQRKGWFERADGGTLFLDEIGELPLAAQVRLLRVLQEHHIERVGGQETIHVDVRIVAATHRDLAAMVHEKTFREDLWYRINMFPILLPRLCERLEDIPALAKHFVRKAAASFGFPYVELSIGDIDRLLEYDWPGNIRELQAVIDRAVILGRGVKLDIATALGIGLTQRFAPVVPESDEPTFYEVIPETPASRIPVPAAPATSASDTRVDSLNEAIRRHIERALILTKGQIEGKRGAAQVLNINPHTLRAKMRKLSIRWNDYRDDR